MLVFFMEMEDFTSVEMGEMKAMEGVETKEQEATRTINSMLGNVENGTGTMRVKGAVGQRTLHILLDTRSSHNFLNEKFNKVGAGKITEMQPL